LSQRRITQHCKPTSGWSPWWLIEGLRRAARG
jgi:hypothetical protein